METILESDVDRGGNIRRKASLNRRKESRIMSMSRLAGWAREARGAIRNLRDRARRVREDSRRERSHRVYLLSAIPLSHHAREFSYLARGSFKRVTRTKVGGSTGHQRCHYCSFLHRGHRRDFPKMWVPLTEGHGGRYLQTYHPAKKSTSDRRAPLSRVGSYTTTRIGR